MEMVNADNSNGKIGILFNKAATWENEFPLKSKDSLRVYSVFAKRAKKHGLDVFLANYMNYKKGGILRQAWLYENGKWAKTANQEIDLVYSRFNRAMFHSHRKVSGVEKLKYIMCKEVKMINHPSLEEFCWDKHMVSELFPEYTPKTFLVNTAKGLQTVLPEIKSEKIVLKPRYGTLGKGVIVTDKRNIPKDIRKNTIVQECIDTSNGIKGVLENKRHDLRIIIINGKIDHAHIRVPKKGMLVANMALGGKKIFIPNEQIPKRVVSIVKGVDRMFRNYFPRIYSIDFLVDGNQNPFIVECNSQPMINRYAFGAYKKPEFFDRMLEAMKQSIRLKVVETVE